MACSVQSTVLPKTVQYWSSGEGTVPALKFSYSHSFRIYQYLFIRVQRLLLVYSKLPALEVLQPTSCKSQPLHQVVPALEVCGNDDATCIQAELSLCYVVVAFVEYENDVP